MAEKKHTIFQNLGNVIFGSSVSPDIQKLPPTADVTTNRVLYSTNNRNDYERKLQQYKQQKFLSYQWAKAGADNALESLAGYTAVKLMYRDADLMDEMPEIGAALDIIQEEACSFDSEGKMLHVKSKSKRIKAILEDLFYDRLNIHVMLPMVARSMVKYGNEFMLLNIDQNNGILGWKELPVYEMDRIENGYTYAGSTVYNQVTEIKPDETRFIWVGHNEGLGGYRNWQVAHFRLLKNSLFLPYGVSHLHKARRAWRMWSMMEDAMLIYRLDKSVERRVFKVYVGAIDDQDVPAFIQEFANNFKRTPIIDPATGQVDLRKNFLDVSSDYFIPVRDPSAPTPIENLQSAQNQTQMDDINYMQNKVFAALRVPKTFLNFQEAQGKGQNLSLLDIRFSRMVNSIQQFLLMELNKIAMIHLHFMGLDDEITNFTLAMNNPSAQIEALELEDITKRIQTATAAISDPGTGIPLMSLHMALKKIMKMSDAEIKDMLLEIRLEKAMAAELQQTANIIKQTGIFDSVDRIYGDFNAMNNPQNNQMQQQGEDQLGGMGGGMPGGAGGGGFDGGSLNMDSLGGAGTEGMSDMSGNEASLDMSQAPDADNGGPINPVESRNSNKPKLNETSKQRVKSFTERYFERLNEAIENEPDFISEIEDFEGKNVTINEKVNDIFNKINTIIEENNFNDEKTLDDSGYTENEFNDEFYDLTENNGDE